MKDSTQEERELREKILKNRQYFQNIDWTTEKAQEEIRSGLTMLNRYPQHLISFFGGARMPQDNPHFTLAYDAAHALASKNFAVLSGGGTGIMEAANRGAIEAGGVSLSIKAGLIHGEEVADDIYTESLTLHFIFVRRFLLAIKSEALLFFPGGFGTLSEFFEFLVLIQLHISDDVPLIFVDRNYWEGLLQWLDEFPHKQGLIVERVRDIAALKFADTAEEIVQIVTEAVGGE